MKFKLDITIDNEAFQEFNGAAVAEMLTELASKIEGLQLDSRCSGPLLDVNGNTVGKWQVKK